jgi:hypothetical protein
MATQSVIDFHKCSERRSIKITVANTPAAEAAFIAFYGRLDLAAKAAGRSYGDYAIEPWGRDEEEQGESLGQPGDALAEILFPTCEHGMSYHSCYGPDHFMSADQEIERYGY